MKMEERIKALEDHVERKKRELREATLFLWGIAVGALVCLVMVLVEVYL